jgi:predicted amidohydrolase YtcJ
MPRRRLRIGVNPYYLYYRSEFNAPDVGTDRAYTAARLRTLVDAGVPTSLHADSPVAPPRPLEEVWIAVNRFGLSGKVRGAEERISVDQALRMVTTDAAFSLDVEDAIGSIAPGKYADFAVWSTVVGGMAFPASEIRPQ